LNIMRVINQGEDESSISVHGSIIGALHGQVMSCSDVGQTNANKSSGATTTLIVHVRG